MKLDPRLPIGPRAKRRPWWKANPAISLADMSRRNKTKVRRLRGRANHTKRVHTSMWPGLS